MNTLTNITKWYEQYHDYILQIEPAEGQPLFVRLDCTDLPKILGVKSEIFGKASAERIIKQIKSKDISEDTVIQNYLPHEREGFKLRLQYFRTFMEKIDRSQLLYVNLLGKMNLYVSLVFDGYYFALSLKKIEGESYKIDTFEAAAIPTFYPGLDRLVPIRKIKRKIDKKLFDFAFDEETLQETLRDHIIDSLVSYHNEIMPIPVTREKFLIDRPNLSKIILAFCSFGGEHEFYYSVDLLHQTWTQTFDGEVFAAGDFGSGTVMEKLKAMDEAISQYHADTYDTLIRPDPELLRKKGYIENEKGFLIPIES